MELDIIIYGYKFTIRKGKFYELYGYRQGCDAHGYNIAVSTDIETLFKYIKICAM